MSVAAAIEEKLRSAFAVDWLELDNESDQHSGPPGRESHFRLVLVSGDFAGQRPVRRHQAVYAALAQELDGPVHALSMHLFTPEEWTQRGEQAAASPACRGGSKSAS